MKPDERRPGSGSRILRPEEVKPCAYKLTEGYQGGWHAVKSVMVEIQPGTGERWAVTEVGCYMNKHTGEFTYIIFPTDGTEENWLFDSPEEAAECYRKFWEPVTTTN